MVPLDNVASHSIQFVVKKIDEKLKKLANLTKRILKPRKFI